LARRLEGVWEQLSTAIGTIISLRTNSKNPVREVDSADKSGSQLACASWKTGIAALNQISFIMETAIAGYDISNSTTFDPLVYPKFTTEQSTTLE